MRGKISLYNFEEFTTRLVYIFVFRPRFCVSSLYTFMYFAIPNFPLYGCFAKQILAFLFCLAIHFLFLPFIIFNSWFDRSRKCLQTVEKFQRILNPVCGDNNNLSFSPNFCFLFQLFQVELKTVRFLKSLTNSSTVYGLWSRYSSCIKSLRHEWRLPHNLFSINCILLVENIT